MSKHQSAKNYTIWKIKNFPHKYVIMDVGIVNLPPAATNTHPDWILGEKLRDIELPANPPLLGIDNDVAIKQICIDGYYEPGIKVKYNEKL